MVMIGETIVLQTPLSNQIVKQFFINHCPTLNEQLNVLANLRNEIKDFVRLRRLTVVNTRSLNWNPNAPKQGKESL